MPTANGDNVAVDLAKGKPFTFFIPTSDWLLWKEIKASGRVKHGEISRYLRHQLWEFMESHRGNPKRKPKGLGSEGEGHIDG
jgi:hypothetical protein